jgi:hypothetical protein
MSQWAIGRLRVGVFSHRDAAKGPSVQHSEAQNLHARIGGTRQEQTKNGNDVMERNAAGLPALIATAATPAVRKLDRIDVCVARPARVRNFLGGGEANFESDRRAIEYAAGDMPGGMEAARATVRSLGTFMVRAVRYLGGECGVRQYMNLGTPIPTADDVHVVAQHMAPESRIMYFGNDPVVMAHAHSLRRSTRDGVAGYVHTKLRHPDELLEKAAATLDFASPVAVMLLGTLAFVPDEHDPPRHRGQAAGGAPGRELPRRRPHDRPLQGGHRGCGAPQRDTGRALRGAIPCEDCTVLRRPGHRQTRSGPDRPMAP